MDLKNTLFAIGLVVVVVFIGSCAKSPAELPAAEEVVSEQVAGLMDRLNSTVGNYKASYKIEHEVHAWFGHSGATDYIEHSIVEISVLKNEVASYSFSNAVEGSLSPLELQEKNYYRYYDAPQKSLCTRKFIQTAKCEFGHSMPPKLGGKLTGCKATIFPDGRGKCICNGEPIPIEQGFACSEEVNTENMRLEDYGNSVYYPENGSGVCYYIAVELETGEQWAFECENRPVLSPIGLANFSGVKCESPGLDCFCDINPPQDILSCLQENPENFDSETKSSILNHLESIEIASISEEDNGYGRCYAFSHDGLEHTFCFNEQNRLTFAQWGRNITKDRITDVDINKIIMVQK